MTVFSQPSTPKLQIVGEEISGVDTINFNINSIDKEMKAQYSAEIDSQTVNISTNLSEYKLNISMPNLHNQENWLILVSDKKNAIFYQNTGVASTNEINLSGYIKGDYLLSISNSDNKKSWIISVE